MGRKKKSQGSVFVEPDGRRVRLTEQSVRLERFLYQNAPRGKTGATWSFTTFLKRISPLIYVFIVKELKKSLSERNPKLQRVIEEWEVNATRPTRPTARELTAYVIERGMDGAWEIWEVKRPYSEAEPDSFYRRYIQGHAGAIRDFREALNMPQPWPDDHAGHAINWFLGGRGDAARNYQFLTRTRTRDRFLVITAFDDE
jgi:hypothetical protein